MGAGLADGRECKLLTGIDDHSGSRGSPPWWRFLPRRAVCAASTAAMRRYGAPPEVLTDNGIQFTGRLLRAQPVEVLFERICREDRIL